MNNGDVGIGRIPTANRLEVEGDASKTTAGAWLANSDARIKTEVRDIDNALAVIDRLRPVRFRYTEECKAAHPSIHDGEYYNYIAQEYREVFPDYVQASGEDDLLQLDAYPASIYAVRAIQELHQMVKEKDAHIAALEQEIAALKALNTPEQQSVALSEQNSAQQEWVTALEQQNKELARRLAAVEERLGTENVEPRHTVPAFPMGTALLLGWPLVGGIMLSSLTMMIRATGQMERRPH